MSLGFGILGMAQSIQKVDVSIFPKPEKGMKKVVIEVPHSEKDSSKKIEIVVGKYMETDTCNHYGLSGEFSTHDLKGWGYQYLTFQTNGATPSTMMACNDSEKIHQFVFSKGHLMDYNGKMPVVLYLPEGYEAKFKIYTSNGDLYSAQEIPQNK